MTSPKLTKRAPRRGLLRGGVHSGQRSVQHPVAARTSPPPGRPAAAPGAAPSGGWQEAAGLQEALTAARAELLRQRVAHARGVQDAPLRTRPSASAATEGSHPHPARASPAAALGRRRASSPWSGRVALAGPGGAWPPGGGRPGWGRFCEAW